VNKNIGVTIELGLMGALLATGAGLYQYKNAAPECSSPVTIATVTGLLVTQNHFPAGERIAVVNIHTLRGGWFSKNRLCEAQALSQSTMSATTPYIHYRSEVGEEGGPYIGIEPNVAPYAAKASALKEPKGGGDSGGRSSLTASKSKGNLPKASLKQFIPPIAVLHNLRPKLSAEPIIMIAPPEIKLPQVRMAQYGDPLAKMGPPSNGPGSGGGIGSGSGGGVFRGGGGVSAPSVLYKVEPEYSEEARKAHYQGTVVLYVEVDGTGHPSKLSVVRSLGLGLDEKAIEAVRKWRFRPGYRDGHPVTVAATIEVNFRLLEQPEGWCVMADPCVLYKVEPEYSEEARRARYQGTVVLHVDVDAAGRPINVRVVRGLGLGLDEKAIEAVGKWKFRPGYRDGYPVTAAATIEVNFRCCR
jgi:TonB family protein